MYSIVYKKYKIWTSDKILIKGLEKKGYKICITTKELKAKLYKKKHNTKALAERIRENETLPTFTTSKAIRNGNTTVFFCLLKG